MQLTIKDKTFNIWSKKRILYTICFFMFCVIDQRTKTGSGLDGIIETFRDMAGVLMAVIIMSHYKWEEFVAYKIPYAVWTGIGLVAGVLFVVLGQPLAYFMNERVMVSLDVFLFGYVVIHTFISVVKEKKYPKLNKGMFGLWVVMMLLMIFSRSDYVWPFCYFIRMFLPYGFYGRGAGGLVSGNHERSHLRFFCVPGILLCVPAV